MTFGQKTRIKTPTSLRPGRPARLREVSRAAAPFITATLAIVLAISPVEAQTEDQTCLMCHGDPELVSEDGRRMGVAVDDFRAGVHSGFGCTSCHISPGDYESLPHYERYVPVDCSTCHAEAAATYHSTSHGQALRRGEGRVPGCADCHGRHGVLAASDSASPTNPAGIPHMCGKCHGEEGVITRDYVRLPVSLPGYLESVHEIATKEGKRAAVCTDCHGAHDLRTADDPMSSISRFRISETCGKCHVTQAEEYNRSVHGKAVALGLTGSPTCTGCHNEHSIRRADDPRARTNPERRSRDLCGHCHIDPDLVAKYRITPGVVESYLDSYHGWTVGRGGRLVATCTDCHNVHDITGPMDPSSSVHPANVTATCGRCHEGSNPTFARSYTHLSALRARGYHGWARLIYLWIIAVVLGAMVLHNSVITGQVLVKNFRKRRTKPYVIRWRKSELVQHWILLIAFSGLAITGFALRFPDAWWVRLIGLGGREAVRANLHRVLAVTLIANAVYHIYWIALTGRGRSALKAVLPRLQDFTKMIQCMGYRIGLMKVRPAFGYFDYTQKAEYWAVFWGTFVMAVTGFVLWFPTIATSRLPAWTVRVSEVIHFYEAILAVSSVAIWHLFHVIFTPEKYPMSTVWINGRMPSEEWKELHRGEYEKCGEEPIRYPGREDGKSSRKDASDPTKADRRSQGTSASPHNRKGHPKATSHQKRSQRTKDTPKNPSKPKKRRPRKREKGSP